MINSAECPQFDREEQRIIAIADTLLIPSLCDMGGTGLQGFRYSEKLPEWKDRARNCGEAACAQTCEFAQMLRNVPDDEI